MRRMDGGLPRVLKKVTWLLAGIACLWLLTADVFLRWPFRTEVDVGVERDSLAGLTPPTRDLPPLGAPVSTEADVDLGQRVRMRLKTVYPGMDCPEGFDASEQWRDRMATLAQGLAGLVPELAGRDDPAAWLALYVPQAFPTIDHEVAIDVASVIDSGDPVKEIASSWLNRARGNGLVTGRFCLTTVGIARANGRIDAVLLLARPIATYDSDFPGMVGGTVRGHFLDQAGGGPQPHLQGVVTHRGWFEAVREEVLDVPLAPAGGDSFQLTLPKGEGLWTRVWLAVGNRGLTVPRILTEGDGP